MGVIATTFGGKVVWDYVSQFEVTEGLVAVAFLLLCAVVIESYGFGLRLDSPSPRNRLNAHLSHLFTFLALGGTLSYVLLVLCNTKRLLGIIDVNGWNVVQYPLSLLGFLGGTAMGPDGRLGYGALAFLAWGATILFLSLVIGFPKAVKFFALPALVFLTAEVFLFDPREMDSQAINLVSDLTFKGMPLLSNWFLLTVSLFFTVFGLTRDRVGVFGRTRSARARLYLGLRRLSSTAHASRVATQYTFTSEVVTKPLLPTIRWISGRTLPTFS